MPRSTSKGKASIGKLLAGGTHEALAYKRGRLPGARVTRAKVTLRRAEVVPPPE